MWEQSIACHKRYLCRERNMVLAALKGKFSFERVAQERVQWSNEDIRKRDQVSRSNALWAEDDDDVVDDDDDGDDDDGDDDDGDDDDDDDDDDAYDGS